MYSHFHSPETTEWPAKKWFPVVIYFSDFPPCLQHSVFTGKFSDAMRICCHFSAALLRCLIGVTAPENRTFAWPWARAIRTPQTPSRCGEKGWTLPHPRACAFYPPSFIRRGLPFHSIHPPHYRQACLGH
jgi:hypothetical protein